MVQTDKQIFNFHIERIAIVIKLLLYCHVMSLMFHNSRYILSTHMFTNSVYLI